MAVRGSVFALLLALALAAPVTAQVAPGCGPAKVKFEVTLAKTSNPVPAPEPGKALVVFVQDSGTKEYAEGTPLTQFGIDGAWVGAAQGDAYFLVPVAPGEHHLCSNWQTKLMRLGDSRTTAALHFTAEAGETYFFGTKYIIQDGLVLFDPLDSDEAKLLITSFALATSHEKK
jgi:hypothetical protein